MSAVMTAGAGEKESARERTIVARVVEKLPNNLFRLEAEGGFQITAHALPVVERGFLRLLPGDRVKVVLSPNDTGRGRIVKRD